MRLAYANVGFFSKVLRALRHVVSPLRAQRIVGCNVHDATCALPASAAFSWDDIGDFDSLATLLAGDEPMTVLGDTTAVHTVDATGLVVTGGRTIAVVGLEDVVVVDTPDAVLVTSRARAQEVKAVVAALKESGRTDLV